MKKISNIFLLLAVFFILCGFKHTTIIEINKDNSIDIEVDLLVKDTKIYESDYNALSDNVKNYEKNGFKVQQYKEQGYKGYRVTKKIDDIKEVSKNKNEEISISNILDNNFYINGLFTLKDYIVKKDYSAKYKYVFNEKKFLNQNYINLLDDNSSNSLIIEEENEDTTIYDNTSEYELSLIVKLPNRVSNSNASKVSINGKNLTWIFAPNEEISINFSFEVINKKSLIIISVSTFAILIGLFIILIILRKKKSSKEMLICTSFDPSIEGVITETITDRAINSNKTLKFKKKSK